MRDAAEQCDHICCGAASLRPGKFCRSGRFFREIRAGEGLESLILQGFSAWHGAC
jgi:hypothetical protein